MTFRTPDPGEVTRGRAYEAWRVRARAEAPWADGVLDYEVDATKRVLEAAGIEDPMPDLDALTPQKRYLFLRQMLDIHRATSRRDPRIDRLPDPMIPGVSHYARVDVLLITYDDVDYLVQPSRPGEIGRAERDVGEGTHAPALAAHLGCALHNGVARLRYYVTGGHVA